VTPPTITLRAGAPTDLGAPALVLLTSGGEKGVSPLDPAAVQVAGVLGVASDRILVAERARGDAGEVVAVPLAREGGPDRLLFVGTGAGDAAAFRTAGAAVARRGAAAGWVAVDARSLDAAAIGAFVEGLALAAYLQPGSEPPAPPSNGARAGREAAGGGAAGGGADHAGGRPPRVLAEALLVVDDPDDPAAFDAVARSLAVARAVHLARDLVNTPSLVKSPAWLADRAVAAAAEAALDVEVLGADELAAGGFGGLLGVSAASPRPPRLVRLSYSPPADSVAPPRHVVLVGKGITFDSGGLSLKPAVSMVGMKTDMAGSAAVLGTMTALAALGCQIHVTGLMCIAENMIGAGATRPGDVLTIWGGTTVEVLNTDAEGRLVLADGLAYAAATLEPDAIVDLATLTGAISVALGRRTAGLFASDDRLADELDRASKDAGERVWRLPLTDEYRPAIDSPVADLANIGRAMDVSGGSITAALFLREFTAGIPWAHLDIAGAARSDSDDAEITKGGTGWGVRTLLAWLA
jgi:leucyl aminopeptidase